MIDLIRDGINQPGKDARRTYTAAFRTAMSACQRGWTYPEWEALLMEPRSHLGVQMAIQSPQYRRSLKKAWDAAGKRVQESPAMTHDEARNLLDSVEEMLVRDEGIDGASRLVVQEAVDRGRELGTRRVALPWRHLKRTTGQSEWAVKTSLKKRAGGYLELAERGKAGLSGKSNLYWVATPPTSRVSGRSVGGVRAGSALTPTPAERGLSGRRPSSR